jgi:hypothetical protein
VCKKDAQKQVFEKGGKIAKQQKKDQESNEGLHNQLLRVIAPHPNRESCKLIGDWDKVVCDVWIKANLILFNFEVQFQICKHVRLEQRGDDNV